MITITLIGLDQYTVAHYSKDHTKNLADLFETEEDNISFVSTDSLVFHEGIDQPSWNSIVQVSAPTKFEAVQQNVAKYLLNTLKDFSIHLVVEFHYYHDHDRYEYVNKDYPRFLTEANIADVDYDEEIDENTEIYHGNIFEGYEEKLEEVYKEKEQEIKDKQN